MKVNLHIDKLILDGLAVERHQGRHIQTAVEVALARLLHEEGMSADLLSSGTIDRISTENLSYAPVLETDRLGASIASSIFHSIASPPSSQESDNG